MPTPKLDTTVLNDCAEAVKEYGSITAAAKALGIPRATLQHRMKVAPIVKTQKAGRSLNDFRMAHDKDYIVPAKIKAALAALGGGWEYEVDFLRLAGLSVTDLALYRDQFADNFVVIDRSGKRVWAGTKATADQIRGMVRG